MTAFEKYIDDLVNDREPQDDFPKNESSWEELYDLCGKLIAEIVTLKRAGANMIQGKIIELKPGDVVKINGITLWVCLCTEAPLNRMINKKCHWCRYSFPTKRGAGG